MHFKMERQQLRHDEAMAKRAVEEKERIDAIFKVVAGEDDKPVAGAVLIKKESVENVGLE